jgi:hypothetical protein
MAGSRLVTDGTLSPRVSGSRDGAVTTLDHLQMNDAFSAGPSFSVETGALRIRWESDPPVHGLQTVCGRVFNDGPMDARHVRVRVEGLDERGGVTGRREGDVLGQVSSRGIGLFCISMSAGAATYRVTIVRADWVAAPESP